MHFKVQSLVLGLLAVAVAAVNPRQQACNIDTVSEFNPCLCPDGTNYQYYITRAILGVNAKDFYDYTGSFFNLTWLTIAHQTNNGTDNVPGATRTFYTGPSGGGNVAFTDELIEFELKPDGSYYSSSSLLTAPVPYTYGNGSFAGNWITVNAQYVDKYETWLDWHVFNCYTGSPIDYTFGHRLALQDLLQNLGKAGKVKGNVTAQYFTQAFYNSTN